MRCKFLQMLSFHRKQGLRCKLPHVSMLKADPILANRFHSSFLEAWPGISKFYRSSANTPTQKPEASKKDKSHMNSVSDLKTCCRNFHCLHLTFPGFMPQQRNHTFPWSPSPSWKASPEPCVCSCSPSKGTALQQRLRGTETLGREEASPLCSFGIHRTRAPLCSLKNVEVSPGKQN